MSFSQFTLAPNLNEFTSDYVRFQAGRLTYPDPNSVFGAAGMLYTITSGSSLATGTTEQTLATFTIPGNTFDQSGRKIRVRSFWTTASNTHSKTCKMYFGTASISTGAITTGSATAVLEMTITAGTPNGRMRVWGWGFGGTDGLQPIKSTTLVIGNWSSPFDITATGQTDTSAASDITLYDFSIEYLN